MVTRGDCNLYLDGEVNGMGNNKVNHAKMN